MTVSGGTWRAGDVVVGTYNLGGSLVGQGTLTLAGGTTEISGTNAFPFPGLHVALEPNTTGTIWLTGGQLITTNVSAVLGSGFYGSGQRFGHMIVSNGTWRARDVTVGYGFEAQGELKMVGVGGVVTVSSNLLVGNCTLGAEGVVSVYRSSLYVTNAAHTAVLDVANGTLTVYASGTVVADVIVVTNSCGVIQKAFAGGIISYKSTILTPTGDADLDGLPNSWEQLYGLEPFDPFFDNGTYGDPDGDGYDNWTEYLAGSDPRDPLSTPVQIVSPFRITSIAKQGNNIMLNWTTGGGTTNQVQVSPNSNFSTNGFTNLGAQMFIPGSGIVATNYTDTGGATNTPARYYRVRLVP